MTISSYGENWTFWALCSQDPNFIKPIDQLSTSGITSKDYFQHLKVFQRISPTPLEYFQMSKLMVKTEPFEHFFSKIQFYTINGTLFIPFNDLLSHSSTSEEYFHSLSSSTYENSQSFNLDLTLLNQLTSIKPQGWLPKQLFNQMRILPKLIFIPSWIYPKVLILVYWKKATKSWLYGTNWCPFSL